MCRQRAVLQLASTVAQAARRLEANGANKLSPPAGKPEWLKYLLQYTNPLLALLIVAAVLTFVAYAIQDPKDSQNIILGVTLLLVIWLLATTQYMNERAAGSVAAQLRNLLPTVARAVRDGKEVEINAPDLVVGDILHLTIGTKVPADVKVIESKDLKLDFSSLTGALRMNGRVCGCSQRSAVCARARALFGEGPCKSYSSAQARPSLLSAKRPAPGGRGQSARRGTSTPLTSARLRRVLRRRQRWAATLRRRERRHAPACLPR